MEEITGEKLPAEPSELYPDSGKQKQTIIFIAIGLLVILAAVIAAVILLMRADPNTTAQIRDVFLIFMALESLLLGLAVIILIIQIARLTNLLQNEVKPILESTNETISTLRGTTNFLSDNLVQPVIKLNEYLAALSQVGVIFGLGRKKNQNSAKQKKTA